MQTLLEMGVSSIINNRPDFEAHMQPLATELAQAATEIGIEYRHIPMSGGLTEEIIVKSGQAYAELPRPIIAFCTTGTRSAALWAFAHVKKLGVAVVMQGLNDAGYDLEQIRPALEQIFQENI